MRPACLLFVVLAACRHDAPFAWAGPDPLGPITSAVPRRLTLNPGDDRNPSVTGGTLVFSRWDPSRHDRERCLAFLPPEGGTLRRTVCPPPPRSAADTFVDTWVEPALSADGEHVAFVWQRGASASYYTWTRDLVVAPVSDPSRPSVIWPSWFFLPDGRIATAAVKPMWLGGGTVRFLAAYERVFKVKGGGAERLTDTVMDVFALFDLDVASGTAGIVRGADSAIAYAPAPGGGVWLVKSSDSTRLLLLAPGADTAVTVGAFSGPVADLAAVAGGPVAVLAAGTVEWLDLTTGASGRIEPDTPVRRVAPVPGMRAFVAELEKSAEPLSGEGANLWLFGLP